MVQIREGQVCIMMQKVERKPLVSVLMTAYNREKYIVEAIDSVLASTYLNFELIIVDDCSTDTTVNKAELCAVNDSRVSIYKNNKNLGDYPNRNQAAKYASGEYIKYLDSDDIIYPQGLEVMISCMESYPEAGFGLCEIAHADEPHPVFLNSYESYYENFMVRDLFGRSPGSSIMKRAAFEESGGFTGKRQVGDHEFWLIMARKYSMVTMPRDLSWDRTHGEQEKMYDSFIEKSSMHFSVQFEQLKHPECPLSEDERTRAISLLRSQQARVFWSYAVRQKSPFTALRYKKLLGLPWNNLLSVR